MNILVTGASGFIGSNLVEELVSKGYRVSCLVRSQKKIAHLRHLPLNLITADLRHPAGLKNTLSRFELIFHLAGITKGVCPQDYFSGNLDTTRNLLELAGSPGSALKRLVYVSSQAAAGPSLDSNFAEYAPTAAPVSAYGRSKLQAEQAVLELAGKRETVILRPAVVFGPRDREMLPLFNAARWGIIPQAGFGDFPANFIYVKDLVKAIILAGEHEKSPGETFFVHNGAPSSWRAMNRLLAREINPRARTLPIYKRILQLHCLVAGNFARLRNTPTYMNRDKWLEIRQAGWLCSGDRIMKRLDFHPDWNTADAVRQTYSWYKQHNWIP